MTAADYSAMLPLLVQAGGVFVLLAAVCVRRHHGTMAALSVLTNAAALAALPVAAGAAPHAVGAVLVIDRLALFYLGLVSAGSLVVAGLAHDYLERRGVRKEEFYILLQAATTGAAVLTATAHFAIIFLGLELMSVSLYGMVAYVFNRPLALEAAVKYLILAAASSAFLLLGFAIIYGESGDMTMAGFGAVEWNAREGSRVLVGAGGAALLLTGVAFKLALVPCHMWVPDIYQGAPVPVAAFFATVAKGAVISVLLRFAQAAELAGATALQLALGVLAVASMLVGNLLALRQRNLSRILAYSSIAHLGYVLVAVIAGPALGADAVTFYVASYFATSLAAFGVIGLLSPGRADFNELAGFQGLAWRRPLVAFALVVALLSLAGLPLTGGFVGKFLLVAAGVRASLWVPVLALVAGSVLGLFYYLRVVAALFDEPAGADVPRAAPVSVRGGVLLSVVAGAVVLMGLHPAPLFSLIRTLLPIGP